MQNKVTYNTTPNANIMLFNFSPNFIQRGCKKYDDLKFTKEICLDGWSPLGRKQHQISLGDNFHAKISIINDTY